MRLFPYLEKSDKSKPYRLFCFPHAGGNSLTFSKWVEASKKIDIVPVSLDNRGNEVSFDKIANKIATEIINIFDGRPFALWGHSMGAAFAFSVAYICEVHYKYQPQKIIVAGRQPPFDKCENCYNCSMGMEALLEDLKRAGGTPNELLESDFFSKYMLPEIMNDYKLHESFSYRGETISNPIIAHCGDNDKEADMLIMKGWGKVTTGLFKIKEFPGNHFFPHDQQDYLSVLEDEILS